MKVNIKTLIDDVQCYETVRALRWSKRRKCPFCNSIGTIKRGYDVSYSAPPIGFEKLGCNLKEE